MIGVLVRWIGALSLERDFGENCKSGGSRETGHGCFMLACPSRHDHLLHAASQDDAIAH